MASRRSSSLFRALLPRPPRKGLRSRRGDSAEGRGREVRGEGEKGRVGGRGEVEGKVKG